MVCLTQARASHAPRQHEAAHPAPPSRRPPLPSPPAPHLVVPAGRQLLLVHEPAEQAVLLVCPCKVCSWGGGFNTVLQESWGAEGDGGRSVWGKVCWWRRTGTPCVPLQGGREGQGGVPVQPQPRVVSSCEGEEGGEGGEGPHAAGRRVVPFWARQGLLRWEGDKQTRDQLPAQRFSTLRLPSHTHPPAARARLAPPTATTSSGTGSCASQRDDEHR